MVDVVLGGGPRPPVPRPPVRFRFDPEGHPPGVYIECGRCGQLVGPSPSPALAWQLWRDEGHDTDGHRSLRVVEKVVEVPGPERVIVKEVEKIVVQERRTYLCHQCNQTWSDERDFDAHRQRCAEEFRRRTIDMLEREIQAQGLQDRLRVRR